MKSRGCRLLVAGASRAARLWSLAGVKEARYDEGGSLGSVCMEDELTFHAEVWRKFPFPSSWEGNVFVLKRTEVICAEKKRKFAFLIKRCLMCLYLNLEQFLGFLWL